MKNDKQNVLKISTLAGLGLTLGLATSSAAFGKTDVDGAIDQLKTNEENAKANKKQYQENVDIVTKNINEVAAAIKTLHDQKTQLVSNSQNLEKNRAAVEKMKAKLAEH